MSKSIIEITYKVTDDKIEKVQGYDTKVGTVFIALLRESGSISINKNNIISIEKKKIKEEIDTEIIDGNEYLKEIIDNNGKLLSLISGYYVDSDGNKWKVNDYDIEKIQRMSASLENCRCCINCGDCTNCTFCINCVDCHYSHYCTNCTTCIECDSCEDCRICKKCNSCKECMSCTSMINAKNKNNHYERGVNTEQIEKTPTVMWSIRNEPAIDINDNTISLNEPNCRNFKYKTKESVEQLIQELIAIYENDYKSYSYKFDVEIGAIFVHPEIITISISDKHGTHNHISGMPTKVSTNFPLLVDLYDSTVFKIFVRELHRRINEEE